MKSLSSLLLLAPLAFAIPSPLIKERQSEQVGTCTLPSNFTPTTDSKLPDPFTFANGTKVLTKAGYTCRQGEINSMFHQYELGTKPPAPTSVKASYASNSITITCSEGGKSISFSATIAYPATGTAPYPAIIGIGGISFPTPSNVAIITFDNDGMAAQQNSASHGTGHFFDLYGSTANAGAMAAWAWGVSRLIDGLEITPAANIDTTHLGVSGCSRNGKGAFVVGALDDRIALTIPQESGSGGAACWRISDSQKAAGANIQTAGEIVGENAWFSPIFNQYSTKTSTLPMDHHMLAGLVAPRGLFVIENDIDWLGPVSTTGCMEIGQLIYQALGVPDNFGFSLVGGHGHCQFPSAQQADLSAYIVNLSSWYDWVVPSLS